MKNLIVGFGKSGKAAESFLHDFYPNEEVVIFDEFLKNISSPFGNLIVSSLEPKYIQSFDRIILSPGVNPNHYVVEIARQKKIPITSELELVLAKIDPNLHTIIGVTGSNGKTTTVHFLTHIFLSAGMQAYALGNNGYPLAGAIKILLGQKALIVLELSSYQMDLLSKEFLHAGLLLNIYENHLDRYEEFSFYAASKWHIKDLLMKNQPLFLFRPCFEQWKALCQGSCVKIIDEESLDFYPSYFFAAREVATYFGISSLQVERAFKNFQKPEHRVEFVDEINGVSFYNDSKATNAEAVLFALENMQKKVLLIAGGEDKKLSYASWQKPFLKKVKKVFAIGKIAKKIQDELPETSVMICGSLKEAVEKAFGEAEPKEIVLLSPGTSSYDMFANFEERGKEFKRCVSRLKTGSVS